mgnify:CR=1 FL=1
MLVPSQLDISIVIPTFGRSVKLKHCLDCISKSVSASNLTFEVLVGVNGPDEQTDLVLKKFADRKTINLKQVNFKEPVTPGSARNLLVDLSIGRWIYFADDDAYLPRMFFLNFEKVVGKNANLTVLGGPNLDTEDSNLFQKACSRALDSRFGTSRCYARYRKLNEVRSCGEESLILCNLFVLRSIIPKFPFHRKLKCAEENYFLEGLKKSGVKFYYIPDLWVYHERRDHLRGFIQQIHKYGFGRGQLLQILPSSFKPQYVVPSLSVLYLLILIPFLLSHSFSVLSAFLILPPLLYIMFSVISSLRRRKPEDCWRTTFGSIFIFPILHVSYGLGFLRGLLRGR